MSQKKKRRAHFYLSHSTPEHDESPQKSHFGRFSHSTIMSRNKRENPKQIQIVLLSLNLTAMPGNLFSSWQGHLHNHDPSSFMQLLRHKRDIFFQSKWCSGQSQGDEEFAQEIETSERKLKILTYEPMANTELMRRKRFLNDQDVVNKWWRMWHRSLFTLQAVSVIMSSQSRFQEVLILLWTIINLDSEKK